MLALLSPCTPPPPPPPPRGRDGFVVLVKDNISRLLLLHVDTVYSNNKWEDSSVIWLIKFNFKFAVVDSADVPVVICESRVNINFKRVIVLLNLYYLLFFLSFFIFDVYDHWK